MDRIIKIMDLFLARMKIQANIVKIFKRYTHTLLQHT